MWHSANVQYCNKIYFLPLIWLSVNTSQIIPVLFHALHALPHPFPALLPFLLTFFNSLSFSLCFYHLSFSIMLSSPLLSSITSPFIFSPLPLPLCCFPSPFRPSPPLSPHSSSTRLPSHLPSLFHLCSPRLSFPLPGHLFIQYGRPISAGSFPREQDF